MSFASVTSQKNNAAALREAAKKKLYKQSKKYRAAQALEAWKTVPEVAEGLDKYSEATQLNTAIELTQQVKRLSKMSESQLSNTFANFAPEHIIRLTRKSFPNLCRNIMFTELALESKRDTLQFVRPITSKPASGNVENVNAKNYNEKGGTDPWGFNKGDDGINMPGYKKAIYEDTDPSSSKFTSDEFVGKAVDGVAGKIEFKGGAFGANGEKFVKGWTQVIIGNDKITVAIEDRRSDGFMVNPKYPVTVAYVPNEPAIQISAAEGADPDTAAEVIATMTAYARANVEGDFTGESLGEIELQFDEYEFDIQQTSVGVSLSNVSEIVSESSFDMSAEEMLVTSAGSTIRMQLDDRAVQFAYAAAQMNPREYTVEYDAGYSTVVTETKDGVTTSQGTKDSYYENAQLFMSAIDAISDTMLNDIRHGGVSRLVCGPAAGSYIKLNKKFTTTGRMPAKGTHQIGELDGIPVFKTISGIIPNDMVLTIWKDEEETSDVAVVFGTLVPFFSTGVIQRKNFYKEAGLLSLGDRRVLNRRFLGLIYIKNMKDGAQN